MNCHLGPSSGPRPTRSTAWTPDEVDVLMNRKLQSLEILLCGSSLKNTMKIPTCPSSFGFCQGIVINRFVKQEDQQSPSIEKPRQFINRRFHPVQQRRSIMFRTVHSHRDRTYSKPAIRSPPEHRLKFFDHRPS